VAKKEGRISKKIHWESLCDIGRVESAIEAFPHCKAKYELQETIVKTIAQKQGLLISEEESEKWGEFLESGAEALVYYDSNDKNKIIKTLDYTRMRGSLSEFTESMIGFNEMFPETKYDLIGFTEQENMKGWDKRIMLKPVLHQNFVEGEVLAELDEPERELTKAMDYFKAGGYTVTKDGTLQKNGWQADDLHGRNIIKTPDGEYFIIDAIITRCKIIEKETKQATIKKSESIDIEKARLEGTLSEH
jgi:hypothetical protein